MRKTRATGSREYNFVLVVLVIEASKLALSAAICSARNVQWVGDYTRGIKYLVPAVLYAIYNSLTFVNLARVDAASYQVLMSSRVVLTALLFQRILGKQLGLVRWISVVILCLGVCIQQLAGVHNEGDDKVFSPAYISQCIYGKKIKRIEIEAMNHSIEALEIKPGNLVAFEPVQSRDAPCSRPG